MIWAFILLVVVGALIIVSLSESQKDLIKEFFSVSWTIGKFFLLAIVIVFAIFALLAIIGGSR